LRIIAGSARGRRLAAPRGLDTRPTADRVRESLFSMLTPRLSGARVLDLFAGSGALGLEALSRGARTAVFADNARAAQQAVRRNIEALSFGERSALLCMDAAAAIARLRGERFDIVFIDPPYAMRTGALLSDLFSAGLLAEDGLIVHEHQRDAEIVSPYQLVEQRRYGDTMITFMRNTPEGSV